MKVAIGRGLRTVGAMVVSAIATVGVAGSHEAPAGAAGQILYGEASWLSTVNFYRTESGLSPVTEDAALSAGVSAHARYMIGNQVLVHDEVDGGPHWTPEGDRAGNHSNVAVSGGSTTDRAFVELFMTAPYHALGILRPGVQTVGYGRNDNAAGARYRSASALDILSGYHATPVTEPVVFPGQGSIVPLDRFIAEYPDPRDTCGWSGQTVGLPLIAMLPESPTNVSATLNGPTGDQTVCIVSAANTTGLARDLLTGDKAVFVIPRNPLATGNYTARVATASRTVEWSFRIDPAVRNAQPAALPDTRPTASASRFTAVTPVRLADSRLGTGLPRRLVANTPVRLQVTGVGGIPAGAAAVAVNVTAVGPDTEGYLTTYPCTPTAPDVSTVNFAAGGIVPNHTVVPLDATGGFCVVASTAVDVLIDVFGAFVPGGSAGYRPVTPARVADTRSTPGGRRTPGTTLKVAIRGRNGVSSTATAVALNVTAVRPDGTGYVTVHPCLANAPLVSSLNLSAGEDRPNLVIVPLSAAGEVCLTVAETSTDLLVDLAGELSPTAATTYTPLAPIRLADTRSYDGRLNAGSSGLRLRSAGSATVKAANTRGAPDAVAAMVNVTVTDPAESGYVTVHPCSATLPDTSTVNFQAGQTAANAAIALLDGDDELCTWGYSSAHVIVDLVGVWR